MKNIKKEVTNNYNSIIKNKDLCKWFAYILGSIAYIFSIFHRINTVVLIPYLAETFRASSGTLGFMSSMFFYIYGPFQLIVGVLVDKWEPRKVLTLFVFIMSLGTLIFAYSPRASYSLFGEGFDRSRLFRNIYPNALDNNEIFCL